MYNDKMYTNKSKSSKYRSILFDILFINFFGISFIYYCFPFLSSIIPSRIWVAIPLVFAVLDILVNIQTLLNNKLTYFFLSIVLIFVIFVLFDNVFIKDIVLSSTFLLRIVTCLFLIIALKDKEIFRHLKIDAYILGIMGIIACLKLYIVGNSNEDQTINYMSLGYGLALPALICFELNKIDGKKIEKIIPIIFSIFVFLFGNRGALLLIIMYLVINFIFMFIKMKSGNKLLLGLAIIVGLFCVFVFGESILLWIKSLLGDNIISRNIDKLLGDNLLVDENRSIIYSKALSIIAESPFAIRGPGYMETVDISSLAGANAHNFLIELWLEYGVVFGTIISVAIIVAVICSLKNAFTNKESAIAKLAYVCMFQSFVMLFFSGTLYTCSHLWMGLIIVGYCKIEKRKK